MENKKLCPHCKKEVDQNASRCPHCHGKIYVWTKGKKILAIAIGVLIFGSIVSSSQTPSSVSPSSSSVSSPSVQIGDNAFIQVPGAGPDSSPVFYTQASLNEYIKAATAHDTYGMAQIITLGGGFFVDNGTRVLIIDSGFDARKFRILSGDHQGDTAWLPTEFLKK